jgi:outer membrane usher protein
MTIVGLLAMAAATAAQAADETLLLDVHINGYAIGLIGEFTQRDQALFARRTELRDLGLQVPPRSGSDPDELIDLAQLPGLSWRLDRPAQALYVVAANDSRLPTRLGIGRAPTPQMHIQSGVGATLNYDLSLSLVAGRKLASGLFDLRAFSLLGVVNSGFLVRAGPDALNSTRTSFIRLDTAAQYSDVNSLRRYTLGDFVSDGLSWTRPVRMGGAQLRSDFTMRPDMITFPLPSLSGVAAVPSTLDVFANGVRLLSEQVEPGPFEMSQLPVVNGAGRVSMRLTDPLGNQVVSSTPFYASPSLLAPGLQTFSVQSGVVRRRFGLASNDYGGLAGSAVYRRGLTSGMTVETSVEGAASLSMAGAGLNLNLFDLAVIDVAVAASRSRRGRDHGHTGGQFSLGVQRVGRVFSYSGTAIFAHRAYRDIAGVNGDPSPLLQLTATLGVTLGQFGALGVAYARIDRPFGFDLPVTDVTPPRPSPDRPRGGIERLGSIQRARLLSASYSIQVRAISVYAAAYHNFSKDSGSGISLNLSVPFGPRGSTSASLGHGSSGSYWQAEAQRSAASIGDLGYQAYVSGGAETHEFVQLQYRSRYALYTVGADRNAGKTALQVQARGALSLVEGTLFGSNSIPDSFALVKTGSLRHVHVLQENRAVGTTNRRGMLVVADLRAFEINRLAIDPDDIPLDATVDATTREVRPQDRSGVVVSFPVELSHGALLRLRDGLDRPMPVGSTATLVATGAIFPVGYDGEAYVEGLARHNTIRVETPGGVRCDMAFDYAAVHGEIPRIGPLHCRVQVR